MHGGSFIACGQNFKGFYQDTAVSVSTTFSEKLFPVIENSQLNSCDRIVYTMFFAWNPRISGESRAFVIKANTSKQALETCTVKNKKTCALLIPAMFDKKLDISGLFYLALKLISST